MALTPDPNRTAVFIDGQNLYKRLRECFPDMARPGRYDVLKLAEGLVALAPDRTLSAVHYYTGIQDSSKDPAGYAGKQKYLAGLANAGVVVTHHTMKYAKEWVLDRNQPAPNPCCQPRFVQVEQSREKGIDILMALDLVLMADANAYDTAIVVSQDTDLDVAVAAALHVAGTRRYIAIENAFIVGTGNRARLANTVPRSITRQMLENMKAI